MNQNFQVFICYSPVDKDKAHELYNRLQAVEGVTPWLDEENLLPGQDWKRETRRALRRSTVILILLSKIALRTPAFNNSLLKDALEVADEQPEGKISVVPVRLEECDLPYSLEDRNLHPLDYFNSNGFVQLIRVLNSARPVGNVPLSSPLADSLIMDSIIQSLKVNDSAYYQLHQDSTVSKEVFQKLQKLFNEKQPEKRFLDVAMSDQIVVGEGTELLVMIRLPESEGLRKFLQEYDIRVQSENIKSKDFEVDYEVDDKGNFKPIGLWIELISVDFNIPEKLRKIKLQPSKDSEVFEFLLYPIKSGNLILLIKLSLDEEVLLTSSIRAKGVKSLEAGLQSAKALITLPLNIFSTKKSKGLSGNPQSNREGHSAGHDVIQADQNKGIISTGGMGNVNSGSGQQFNIDEQRAGRDIYQGNTTIHHHHYPSSQAGPSSPDMASAPKPAQNQRPTSPDFAGLTPRPGETSELYDLTQELLKLDSVTKSEQRANIISFLPREIRNRIQEGGNLQTQVFNLVQTCNRYPDGLKQLLEAIYRIEGDSLDWRNLVNYLTGLKH